MHTVWGKSGIQPESAEAAELVDAFVRAETGVEAAAKLECLFSEYLGGWCHDAARRALLNYGVRGADQIHEEEEIAAEVMLHMTSRLRELRSGTAPPIENLRAYTVTAVYNACFARVRARCPRHIQLQNRIRYLLRNDREFATWPGDAGEPLAGLSAWQGRQDVAEAVVPQRSRDSLKELLLSVFEVARGPLRLSDVVGAAADSLGLTEPVFEEVDAERHAAREPAADLMMMQRQELEKLWREVVQLPTAQRAALLLNLRDAAGQGVIELIPSTGTASFAQLAAMVNLSEEALAAVWSDLPLEDGRIAEMLSLTRQQVINLRKSARERLARRQLNPAANMNRDFTSAPSGGRFRDLFRRTKRS